MRAAGHRALALASAVRVSRVAERLRGELESVRRKVATSRNPRAYRVAGVSPVTLTARLKLDDPAELDAIAARLRADRRIAAVERNRIIRRPSQAVPSAAGPPVDDVLYPWQAWHYGMVGLPGAWRHTTGSASVVVAVVDDGIRFDHPDLAGNLTSDGYDFVSNTLVYDICSGGTSGRAGDGDGYDPDPEIPLAAAFDPVGGCIDLRSIGGHGLHVAGTIGATSDDGVGGAGVNWRVSIRPVRVLDVVGSGTWYDIAQGILYAAGLAADDGSGGTVRAPSRADVINLSLGGSHSTDLENAIEAAAEAGSLIIAAAGNDASSNPNYPAAYPEVISVSAVDPYGDLAWYSTFGPTIELAAPGGDSTPGCDFGVVSTQWDFGAGQPTWNCLQGTSMAAPHVSGVAALLFAAEPGISAGEARARLRDWAVDAGPAGRDDEYGYGIVNARNSITERFEPEGDVRVRLIDAGSGRVVDEVPASSGGGYEFTELDDGDYLVFAGEDRSGDGFIGVPGRRWGGFGGTTAPATVTVDGAGTYGSSFTVGFPLEAEPNDGLDDANELPLNGYVRGVVSDGGLASADVFRVRIPEAGSYVVETSGVQGMCGFALEEDTLLQLYDAEGTLLGDHDDVDLGGNLFCSRIAAALDAGTYHVAVWGYFGDRRYQLHVREAN